MEESRVKTLKRPGAKNVPRVPTPITLKEDVEHPFRGDCLCAYVTHFDFTTGTLTSDSKFFPHGLHISPREYAELG